MRPDAHRGGGKRFVVRADEKLTGFLELEAATRQRLWRLARSSTNHSTNPVVAIDLSRSLW